MPTPARPTWSDRELLDMPAAVRARLGPDDQRRLAVLVARVKAEDVVGPFPAKGVEWTCGVAGERWRAATGDVFPILYPGGRRPCVVRGSAVFFRCQGPCGRWLEERAFRGLASPASVCGLSSECRACEAARRVEYGREVRDRPKRRARANVAAFVASLADVA